MEAVIPHLFLWSHGLFNNLKPLGRQCSKLGQLLNENMKFNRAGGYLIYGNTNRFVSGSSCRLKAWSLCYVWHQVCFIYPLLNPLFFAISKAPNVLCFSLIEVVYIETKSPFCFRSVTVWEWLCARTQGFTLCVHDSEQKRLVVRGALGGGGGIYKAHSFLAKLKCTATHRCVRTQDHKRSMNWYIHASAKWALTRKL